MDGWTVTYDVAHDAGVLSDASYEGALEDLTEWLAPYSVVVSASQNHDRYSITLSIENDSGTKAAASAIRLGSKFAEKAGLPTGPIVNVHARTWAEHDLELAEPTYPALVGVAELALLLQVTPQRASELQSRPGFPAPIVVLRSGPVWVRANVENFVATWDRKPGRPRRAPTDTPS